MRLSQQDILRYATWSGDFNPIHVDPEFARRSFFGRTIAHGMLTVSRALSEQPDAIATFARGLEIEFRGVVVADADYNLRFDSAARSLTLAAADEDVVLAVRAAGDTPRNAGTGWLDAARAASTPRRTLPADRRVDDFIRPLDVSGFYETAVDVPPGLVGVPPLRLRVLALCSYVVGMEVPGLRSLFTRLTVSFADGVEDETGLWYRVRRTRFDPAFRMLDTEIDVARADGRAVAAAEIRSYVRFSPVAIDPLGQAARLKPATSSLRGKVAVVTGGTRGLGADITATLAAAGCHVYASYHADAAAATALERLLDEKGLHAEFVRGHAADPAWSAALLESLTARHGGVNLLVLNACAPPEVHSIAGGAWALDDFVAKNLPLASVPLSIFLPTLAARGGALAVVSSSFVEDAPAGLASYVALKQAGEALARAAVREAERPRSDRAAAAAPDVVERHAYRRRRRDPADWAASHIVNAVGAARPARRRRAGVPCVRRRDRVRAARRTRSGRHRRGQLHRRPRAAGLRFWFRELDLSADATLAPYGQILQSLLAPTRPAGARARQRRPAAGARLAARVVGRPHRIARLRPRITSARRERFRPRDEAHRAHAAADTFLLLCPSERMRPIVRRDAARCAGELTGALGASPASSSPRPNATRLYGVTRGGTMPFATTSRTSRIATTTCTCSRPPSSATCTGGWRRCARWSSSTATTRSGEGVVGEVGPEGRRVRRRPPRAARRCSAASPTSGVLVCLCSKNEEPDVWRVFETRADFGLRREQVVAAMINWQPKSQNLRTLAARLNLGLDSFVFIDDNPVECAEVRAGCPEVLTIQWPQRAGARDAAAAPHLGARRRQGDQGRRAPHAALPGGVPAPGARAATLTFEDFIDSLKLEVDFAPLTDEDLRRVGAADAAHQPVQLHDHPPRGSRRAGARRRRPPRDPHRPRAAIGSATTVSSAWSSPSAATTPWKLDTFLLSCRVLGRGVEHQIVADLGRMAAGARRAQRAAPVETTKRNTPGAVVPRVDRSGRRPAQGDEQRRRGRVPADVLAAIRFEPSDAGEVVGCGGRAAPKTAAQPVDAVAAAPPRGTDRAHRVRAGHRRRHARRGRGPRPPRRRRRGPATDAATSRTSCTRRSPRRCACRRSTWHEVDRLEALGCDSLRIVEITVRCSEHFPWLPSTLLFEHRSVSEIVSEIAQLSQREAARAGAGRDAEPRRPRRPGAGRRHRGRRHATCAAPARSRPDELWDAAQGGPRP